MSPERLQAPAGDEDTPRRDRTRTGACRYPCRHGQSLRTCRLCAWWLAAARNQPTEPSRFVFLFNLQRSTSSWMPRANEFRTVPATKKQPDTTLRVIKKIAVNSRGAKRLSMQYGQQLVCVRHRLDSTGTKRLTTVELIVSEDLIGRRPGPTVDVEVHPREKDLQAKLKAAGARWDKTELVWRIRRSTAVALGLKGRIVPRTL